MSSVEASALLHARLRITSGRRQKGEALVMAMQRDTTRPAGHLLIRAGSDLFYPATSKHDAPDRASMQISLRLCPSSMATAC